MDLVSDPDSGAMKCVLCGTVLFTPSYAKLDLGTIINGFLIESKIGQGGMGVVYRAKQLNLERFVALKVLAEHLADDQEFVERFFKEARAAANLNHQNIVQVYDAGSTLDGIYYFAMELIEGETIETRLMRDGVMEPKDALDVALKISHALEYAWDRQKLTHGDIKPDNIIVNTSGGVKLADLGLAKSVHDEKSTQDGGIMATPLYAPPEVISGEFSKIGFRSDMYSFGATFYHMLVGAPPFNAEDPQVVLRMHLTDKPVPVKTRNRGINPLISDIVDRLLAKKPEDRPESWPEVVSSLEKIKDVERKVFHVASHSHEREQPEVRSEAVDEGYKFNHVVTALAAILLLLLSITVVVYLKNFKGDGVDKPDVKPVETASQPDVAKEWDLLKSRVSSMPPQDAIAMVEKFIQKNQDRLPSDANSFYESLRKKVAQDVVSEEKSKRVRERLEAQIDLILRECSSGDFKGKDYSDLQFQSKRIETMLAISSSKNSPLTLDEEQRKSLNGIYLAISQQLDSMRKVEQEAYMRQIEEQRLKTIEEQRLAREKADSERKERLAVNIAMDTYYISLADKPSPADLCSSMGDLLKSGRLPEPLRHSAEFIRSNYVSVPDALAAQLLKIERSLKNKPLPISAISRDYRVEEISEKGIKMQVMIDKVKMGKLLQWQQLPQGDLEALVEKTLLSNDAYKPEASDLASFGSYLVEKRLLKQFRALLGRFDQKANPKVRGWINFLGDLELASREIQAMRKMADVRESLSAGDRIQASEHLADMILNHSSSETFKRYSQETILLRGELGRLNHMLQAASFIVSASRLLAEKKNEAALQSLYCAKSRFFNSEGRQGAKDALSQIETALLASIPRPEELPRTFAPFYKWEKEAPGETLAFLAGIKTNQDFQRSAIKNPALPEMLEASARMSVGEWNSASFSADKMESILSLQGPSSFVLPSLVFASSMSLSRFASSAEDISLPAKMFNEAGTRFHRSPLGSALSLYLNAEYMLSMGAFARAHQMLSSYERRDAGVDMDSRIFLLAAYASLNLPEQEGANPKTILEASKRFSPEKSLAGDMLWLRHSMALLSGGQLSDPQIKELASSDPSHPDICSRIMISSLSLRALAGARCPEMSRLLRIIAAKIAGMTAQWQTFRNLSYLRLSINSYSYEALSGEAASILSEPLVAGIASYPELSMLEMSSACLAGKLSREELQAQLPKRLSESTCASPLEIHIASRIGAPDKHLETISSAVSNGDMGKAFSALLLYSICSADDHGARDAIFAEAKNHTAFMSTEQRLLLLSLERLLSRR